MRKLMRLLVIVLLFWAGNVFATDLISDPNPGAVTFTVEVDGVIDPSGTNIAAQTDGSVLWNVDHLSSGSHTFRVEAFGADGWGSGWSASFIATKPSPYGGFRIVP